MNTRPNLIVTVGVIAASCIANTHLAFADTCHPSGMAIAAQSSLSEPSTRKRASAAPTAWLAAHGTYAAFDRGAGAGDVAALQLSVSAAYPWLRAAIAGSFAQVNAADGSITGLADPIASVGVRGISWGNERTYAVWASAAVSLDVADSMYLGDGHAMAMPGLGVEIQDGAWYAQVDGMYHVTLGVAGHAHVHGQAGIANVINPMASSGIGLGARLGKVLSPRLAIEGAVSGQFADDGIYQAKAGLVTSLGKGLLLETSLRVMSVASSVEPGVVIGVRSALLR